MASSLSVAKEFIKLASFKGQSFTKLELLKLLYMAHGYMLARFDKPLFDDPVQAWQHGPVISKLYYEINHFDKNDPVLELSSTDSEQIGENAIQILSYTLLKHGYNNKQYLYLNNHQKNTPWAKIYDEGVSKVIDNESTKSFFTKLLEKDRIKTLKKVQGTWPNASGLTYQKSIRDEFERNLYLSSDLNAFMVK